MSRRPGPPQGGPPQVPAKGAPPKGGPPHDGPPPPAEHPAPPRGAPPAGSRRAEGPASLGGASSSAGPPLAEVLLGGPESSLLDLVDHLLDQGVVVTGDVVLGLAGVDLVYLRLSLLLAAADRMLPAAALEGHEGRAERGGPATDER